MEKGVKIAALLSFLAAAPAAARVIYLPCDLPLARVAPVVHFKAHIHHRHKHPVGKRGRLGLHFAIARGTCPVFVGDALLPLPEELGGPAGEEPFGGDWLPIEDASTDFGGEGFGSFGGFGGGDVGGAGDVAPFLFEDAPAIVVEDTPVPDVIGGGDTTPSAPVPEPSTWLLILAGFAAIVLKGKRRWVPTR